MSSEKTILIMEMKVLFWSIINTGSVVSLFLWNYRPRTITIFLVTFSAAEEVYNYIVELLSNKNVSLKHGSYMLQRKVVFHKHLLDVVNQEWFNLVLW